jgi:hypothetical protein
MTPTVDEIVDRVLATIRVEPGELGKALGIRFVKRDGGLPPMEYFDGQMMEGPFTTANLRLDRRDGSAFLVLGESREPIMEASVAHRRFEPRALTDINPRVPPEGTEAPTYDVGGIRIAFEFTMFSRNLLLVSFDWPPCESASEARN